MAKIAKVQEVAVNQLKPYKLNAKKHGTEQIEKLKASISEFGFLTPCLIDSEFNLIAGHGRVEAAKALRLDKVPCVFIEGLTEAQRRAYILADNRLGELGEWDMDIVAEELVALDDMDFVVELTGFDMPDNADWFESRTRHDTSRQEGNEEYNEFLDKFEIKKTTDDCYTPDLVYDAVADWVAAEYNLNRSCFVRPFYPGGDYQNEKYADDAVVVDNPPFSILAQILNWYSEHGIRFFLFAPTLTLFSSSASTCCAIPSSAQVIYENGASVNTSFLTNLEPEGVRVRTAPNLQKAVQEASDETQKELHRELPKYSYPDEVITSAMVARWSKYGVDFRLSVADSVQIDALDAQKEAGKAIFGKGYLLSERAAAERAAAERAAAERAAALKWELSDREREIVKSLGGSVINTNR